MKYIKSLSRLVGASTSERMVRLISPVGVTFIMSGQDKRNSEMASTRQIHTLGTSNRTLKEFFNALDAYHIGHIADVRRFPKSRRYPWFNREILEAELQSRGLEYHWLGDLLGGFREGGYDVYKMEMSYLRGLEEIERTAVTSSVALICAERLPWKCHRFHIGESLEERGWDIIHILDKDRTWQPKQDSFKFLRT